jgi:hypothetical protein
MNFEARNTGVKIEVPLLVSQAHVRICKPNSVAQCFNSPMWVRRFYGRRANHWAALEDLDLAL